MLWVPARSLFTMSRGYMSPPMPRSHKLYRLGLPQAVRDRWAMLDRDSGELVAAWTAKKGVSYDVLWLFGEIRASFLAI